MPNLNFMIKKLDPIKKYEMWNGTMLKVKKSGQNALKKKKKCNPISWWTYLIEILKKKIIN